MDNKINKLYAAYRSGCLGDNIFHSYYPFLANIISEEECQTVDAEQVAEKFMSRYDFPLPLNFIRQILSVGVEKEDIIYDQGKYIPRREKFKSHKIDNTTFNLLWERMIQGFTSYCGTNGFNLSGIDVEANIFHFFDFYDENILSINDFYYPEKNDTFDYIWYSYIKSLSENDTELFNFVAAISFSNILKETIFYSNDFKDTPDGFRGLNVYLDTPIVFALLGMDSKERTDSCKMLVSKMQKAGCTVQILDHNFSEIKGIMERAAGWAIDINYDIQKANNVSRFFHDKLIGSPEIAEFCESAETKLNESGITIRATSYDVTQDDFQEDEKTLYSMIEDRYAQDGKFILEEKRQSIMIDVRSIIMVYRERQGRVSTHIQTSGHILNTLNGAIANISKKYESNRSINSGHIPACVSADLFGSVLWLFTPSIKMEYQRKQLLADCFIALRPSKEMLAKYMDTLTRARNAGEIDEKKFLFMRAHAAVNDALMNVTKGDYARFNDQTYREVYDEIVAIADKKYINETAAHEHTKKQLEDVKNEKDKLCGKIDDLQARLDARDEADYNRKSNIFGWLFTILLFGFPYFIIIVIIEILKKKYSGFSFFTMIYFATLILAAILAGLLFKKGKKWCFTKCRDHFIKKNNRNK
jgi:hypothetical protein